MISSLHVLNPKVLRDLLPLLDLLVTYYNTNQH